MKREVYHRGVPGKKWGIWNQMKKCFQFSICEDTPMLAEARLFSLIGDDARKYRFEPRILPAHPANGVFICMDEATPFTLEQQRWVRRKTAKGGNE